MTDTPNGPQQRPENDNVAEPASNDSAGSIEMAAGQQPPAMPSQPVEPAPGDTGGSRPAGRRSAVDEMPPPQAHNQVPAANAPVRPVQPPIQQARPSPFRSGFGAGFGLAVGLSVISVVMALLLLLTTLIGAIGNSNNAQNQPMNTVWGPANASESFLAINISGSIQTGGQNTGFTAMTYGYEIADQLDALEADDYAGVILLMNTPGGTVTGSRAIADAIVRYQDRTEKPVIAYVETMSASGGMYSMAPADLIISDYAAMTGSIGVVMGPLSEYRDVVGLGSTLFKQGVQTTGGIDVHYLSRGTGKVFGNPFVPMDEETRAVYERGLDVEYDNFVGLVSEHRQIPESTIVNDLGAHLYEAETALEKGLIDEIMGRPAGFRRAAEFAGIDVEDFNVVTPTTPDRFSQLLGAENRVWGHGIPLSANDGLQPNNEMCSGSPGVIAYYGNPLEVCGG